MLPRLTTSIWLYADSSAWTMFGICSGAWMECARIGATRTAISQPRLYARSQMAVIAAAIYALATKVICVPRVGSRKNEVKKVPARPPSVPAADMPPADLPACSFSDLKPIRYGETAARTIIGNAQRAKVPIKAPATIPKLLKNRTPWPKRGLAAAMNAVGETKPNPNPLGLMLTLEIYPPTQYPMAKANKIKPIRVPNT